MKKIDEFINLYSLSKTLRFKLIPIGNTEKFFSEKKLLEEDEERAESYSTVKGFMDDYHKEYIDNRLSNFVFNNTFISINEYAELYNKKERSKEDNEKMEKAEESFRKSISKHLKDTDTYKKMNKSEFVRELLPAFLTDDTKKEITEQFKDFTTYFRGFWKNRENMYSDECQPTAIAYRCINDNLPKFLNNCNVFDKIKNVLEFRISELNSEFRGIYNVAIKDMFVPDYFSLVLSQNGISKYNDIIGGYSNSDGSKVQGINELINLYNQQLPKAEKNHSLPKMIPLFKQILSDAESISFIPEKFTSNNSLIKSIREYYENFSRIVLDKENGLECIFSKLNEYDTTAIYHTTGLPLTELSNSLCGNWNTISSGWYNEYQSLYPLKKGKSEDKYETEMKKAFKNLRSLSLGEIQKLIGDDYSVSTFYKEKIQSLIADISTSYNNASELLNNNYPEEKNILTDEKSIELIKNLLDNIKNLEKVVKPLLGTSKEENRDLLFYGLFMPLIECILSVDTLYNKARNYLTQKPYSNDKIKLNFQNPQLLAGWDKNKEKDYRTVLFVKDNNYYLAVMNKSKNKVFEEGNYSEGNDTDYKKIEYKLLPGPNKMLPKVFFAKSNVEYYSPSEEIMSIYNKGTFKKGNDFNINDCHKLIEFFKESINKHPDWNQFDFKFSDTSEYNDISEFYREVSAQGYSIRYKNIPTQYIEELVEKGDIFLFQIYNKDFSPYSHGTPNMHTLYFRELFNPENLKDVVYKLNGEAEMFYRKASIKCCKPTHPANQPIANKNQNNPKKESVFDYDLIKDKRYTERQFMFHVPITMNYKADGATYINRLVRDSLRSHDENYVIGIDRGERNLIYICVIDSHGKIIEQKSLNKIIYKIDDSERTVDYHSLLDDKEKERDNARKNWKSINNIKELKEGYLSAVVNEICKLVVKYDAVIFMENLNRGFKTGRFKVEKQVYQKFENMLINKLNFLVDKNLSHTENGGLLHAYQLTNKADKLYSGDQNGFIFYIPAYLTSKIDPVTGFINLMHPKYTSVENSIEFLNKFKDIYYDEHENLFAFSFDYTNFDRGIQSYKKDWTIYTNGDRIVTFRNKENNNRWDNKIVILTDEFIKLFQKYEIDYNKNLKEQIIARTEKDFFKQLIENISLILQMRNSKTGDVDIDYLISPVKNSNGEFYDSRIQNEMYPLDADANGAYNIARKGLWAINKIKNASETEYEKANIAISNKEWLEYAQGNINE